ncbi:MAG: hypothetical protein ACXVFU_14590 [Nocardioidaceae bacterium]
MVTASQVVADPSRLRGPATGEVARAKTASALAQQVPGVAARSRSPCIQGGAAPVVSRTCTSARAMPAPNQSR